MPRSRLSGFSRRRSIQGNFVIVRLRLISNHKIFVRATNLRPLCIWTCKHHDSKRGSLSTATYTRERWSLERDRRALDTVRSDGKRGFRGQGVDRLHFWEAWNCDDYAVSPGRELFALECIAPLGGRNSPRGTIYRVSWWTWEAAMAACRAKASRRER